MKKQSNKVVKGKREPKKKKEKKTKKDEAQLFNLDKAFDITISICSLPFKGF